MLNLNRLIYGNDNELLYGKYKKSRDFYIVQIVFAQIFALLTSGVLLSGFAVYLDTSDMTNSITLLLPSSAGIFLIFGVRFIEGVRSLKKTVIITTVIAKLLICSVPLIPIAVQKELREAVFITVCAVGFAVQAMSFLLINKWFVRVVPENIRGRYFAVRYSFALLVSIVLPVISGRVLDTADDIYKAFIYLYIAAFVAMFLEVAAIWNIEEPMDERPEITRYTRVDSFRLPFQDKRFFNFNLVLTLFMFVINLSNSYSAVYYLKYLGLPFTIVNLMGVGSAVLQFFIIRYWGKLSDTKGHQYVLDKCIWLFALEALFWMAAPRSFLPYAIPVVVIVSAAANSGFIVGAFNQRQLIIPPKGRIIYDGFYFASVGLAIILASFAGGWVKDFAEKTFSDISGISFIQFRVLYMLNVLGICAIKLYGWITGKGKVIKE